MSDARTSRGRSASRVAATGISEACAPAVLVSLFLLVVAFGSATWPESLQYALVAVGLTTAIPLAGVLVLVRRGHVTDHHVSDRRQRAPVLAGALISIAVGLVVLMLIDAPWAVVGAVLCTVGGVVVVLLVNLWWKLSAHSAVALFVTVGAISLFGPAASVLVVMPLAVGWSRVRLRAHTPAQVAAGHVIGAVIGAAFALFVAP